MSQVQDEEQLFHAASTGDESAYATLYTHFVTPLYRYVYLRVRNKEAAEDLTQTVFLKTWNILQEKKKIPGPSLKSYLFLAARNAIIDHWRKKKDVLVDEIPDHPDHPRAHLTDMLANKQTVIQVMAHISELSPDEQDVILLRFVHEYSTEEIAEMLHKSRDNIRQLQSRGLKHLRSRIKTI